MTTRRRASATAALVLATIGTTACTLLVDTTGFLTTVGPPDASEGGAASAGDAGVTTSAPGDGSAEAALPAPPSDTYAAAVRQDAPLSYWRFEETEGTIAKDELGRHDGTYEAVGELGVAGATPNGHAVEVGAGGSVRIGQAFDLNGDAPYSVEGWMRTNGNSGDLLNKMRYDPTNPSLGWLLTLDMPDGRFSFECWWNKAARRGAAMIAPVERGRFVHVVVTFDGLKAPKLYVNGIVQTDPTKSYQNAGAPIANDVPLTLGGGFAGAIDEVAIYDHVLTLDRIVAHLAAAQ